MMRDRLSEAAATAGVLKFIAPRLRAKVRRCMKDLAWHGGVPPASSRIPTFSLGTGATVPAEVGSKMARLEFKPRMR